MGYTKSMSKETLVFVIGFLVLVNPFLGLPREYKEWVLIGCGILLMIVGYLLRRYAFLKSIEHESGERRSDVFVEGGVARQSVTESPQKDTGLSI